MAMVLFGVASESTVTFSSIPKSLYAGGASMGAPLFAAIDGHYVFYTDTVTTTFETLPNASMALAAYDEELIDLAVLPSRLTDVTRAAGPWAQLPVAAYGLVATLPEPATLVLARDVLARMWTGNISTWDDPAIAALNGGTSPLAGNITLAVTVYDSAADEFASTTGLFARALSLFDPTGFGAAYKASGGILATTVRGLVGPRRLVEVGSPDGSARLAAMAERPGATTYVDAGAAQAANASFARLVNRAGSVVAAPSISWTGPATARGRWPVCSLA